MRRGFGSANERACSVGRLGGVFYLALESRREEILVGGEREREERKNKDKNRDTFQLTNWTRLQEL